MLSYTRSVSRAIVGLALTCAGAGASAAVTQIFAAEGDAKTVTSGVYAIPTAVSAERTSFLASVVNPSFEEFSLRTNLTSILGGNGALSGSGALDDTLADSTGPLGRFDTSGDSAATWYETDATFAISLTNPVKAIGFYLTDYGDNLSEMFLELDGVQVSLIGPEAGGVVVKPGTADGQVLFFGIYSDREFKEIRFVVNQSCDPLNDPLCGPDFVGFDSVVVGDLGATTSVPLPGTLGLIGVGLLGLARVRR